ncbi:uncharacterized protein LOC112689362 [Sipha flava]|uniref:Uncharacterized protein LOC112689362 n=1 Tax=Sipha flava TaxID=143950 RepID=A0A2S2QE55_9HEMI|nr:uncharacterized protein LOC112689362 [Sipha flava]
MVVMYTCCTWIPLRLGSIIVGLISLAQSILIGLVCLISMNMTDTISHEINKLLCSNNMFYTTPIWRVIEKDPMFLITNIMIYFVFYTISCIALIYGALKSSIIFMLPYIILELIRLFVILYVVLTSIILLKINVLDFLILILISVIGVVLLQILVYLWCCPVSLVQCLCLKNSLAFESQEVFNNNNITLPKTATAVVNIHNIVYDPLSDHYGWGPFKPSYNYPYKNMPQYEY